MKHFQNWDKFNNISLRNRKWKTKKQHYNHNRNNNNHNNNLPFITIINKEILIITTL